MIVLELREIIHSLDSPYYHVQYFDLKGRMIADYESTKGHPNGKALFKLTLGP